MLIVSHIKKSFGDQDVLRGTSFDAQSGQLTIIEGENGAGKSTLFQILLGSMDADYGQIRLDDQNLNELTLAARAEFIGILKQDPKSSSSPSLTVRENLALALLKGRSATLRLAVRPQVIKEIDQMLQELEIDMARLLDKPVASLSGGQRQMVAFAMAVIRRPKLMLLDEPTAALDTQSSQQLMHLIKRLAQRWHIPAVMISHDHALNQNYGDHVVMLANGVCHSIF